MAGNPVLLSILRVPSWFRENPSTYCPLAHTVEPLVHLFTLSMIRSLLHTRLSQIVSVCLVLKLYSLVASLTDMNFLPVFGFTLISAFPPKLPITITCLIVSYFNFEVKLLVFAHTNFVRAQNLLRIYGLFLYHQTKKGFFFKNYVVFGVEGEKQNTSHRFWSIGWRLSFLNAMGQALFHKIDVKETHESLVRGWLMAYSSLANESCPGQPSP